MTIILLILKIIGITLAVLVGLVLLFVLLLLFVPFRYAGMARYPVEGDNDRDIKAQSMREKLKAKVMADTEVTEGVVQEEKKQLPLKAHAKVTWLLHLLKVNFDYDNTTDVLIVKLFGFTLFSTDPEYIKKKEEKEQRKKDKAKRKRDKKKAKRRKKKEKEREKRRKAKERAARKTGEPSGKPAEKQAVKQETKPEDKTAEKPEEKTAEKPEEKTAEKAEEKTTEKLAENNTPSERTGEKTEGKTEEKPTEKLSEKPTEKLSEKPTEKLSDKPEDKTLDGLTDDELDALLDGESTEEEEIRKKGVVEKIKNLYNKAKAFYGKLQTYKAFADDFRVRKAIKFLWSKVKLVLKRVLPRKLKGHARFGFENPATTGYVAGVVSMFVGVWDGRFEAIPDFENKCLEADVDFKGKLRISGVAFPALKVWRNKDVKYLRKSFGDLKEGKYVPPKPQMTGDNLKTDESGTDKKTEE